MGIFRLRVAAVKEGACDYLSKPADADDIEAALRSPYEKFLILRQTLCQQIV